MTTAPSPILADWRPIDPKTLREGDVVHVRGTIISAPDGGWLRVSLAGVTNPMSFKLSEIVHVEPRPIAVGDDVKWDCPVSSSRAVTLQGWVEAIANGSGLAWVHVGLGDYRTVEVSALRHAADAQ